MVKETIEWVKAVIITCVLMTAVSWVMFQLDDMEEEWQLIHDPCNSAIALNNPCAE